MMIKYFVQKVFVLIFMCVINMYAGAGVVIHSVLPQEVERLCMDMVMPSVKELEGKTCRREMLPMWAMMPGVVYVDQEYLETPMGQLFKTIAIKGFSATLAHTQEDIEAGEQAFNGALQNEQIQASLLRAKETKTADDWASFNNSLRSYLARQIEALDAHLKLDVVPLETIKQKALTPLVSIDIGNVKEMMPTKPEAEKAFKAALLAVAFGHKLHFAEHPESFQQFAQPISEASAIYMIGSHINQQKD